ncbi:hypothetical protein EVAR_78896_1 [Eumeta japonica]|uniref:Uncharacterized protein n=1 Tax=Eumeta variegata TaxID=151549 RepID=A0A4C1U2L4_EUMVA|nr:hypothetical protein EVAR_78896_1 [Eumeta japonica]
MKYLRWFKIGPSVRIERGSPGPGGAVGFEVRIRRDIILLVFIGDRTRWREGRYHRTPAGIPKIPTPDSSLFLYKRPTMHCGLLYGRTMSMGEDSANCIEATCCTTLNEMCKRRESDGAFDLLVVRNQQAKNDLSLHV